MILLFRWMVVLNDETAKICADYGADCFVAGNYVYKKS